MRQIVFVEAGIAVLLGFCSPLAAERRTPTLSSRNRDAGRSCTNGEPAS